MKINKKVTKSQMLKKWGHTGKSLFYKSVLLLWAALEPIGYRIIFQKIQYSTRSTEDPPPVP